MAGHESETRRALAALELEKFALGKAIEEITEESRRAEERATSDCADRGVLQSGIHAGKIARIQCNRAKRMVDKQVELRRATLQVAPEVASEDYFRMLLEAASATIDRVVGSIPARLRQRGFQIAIDALSKKGETDTHALKAHARREIEMLKREHALNLIQKEAIMAKPSAKDKKKVWVVHGRNLKARDAMFAFLRAIGLDPVEWDEALALTGKGTPYIGEILDYAFTEAQAVVVLITGDDMARLGTRFAEPYDPPYETDLTPQARPNVLFEAGMAFGKYPDWTVLVHLGKTRPFSNVAGRNVLQISNDVKKRQALAERLAAAECDVRIANRTDWHTAGDFDAANESPDLPDRGKFAQTQPVQQRATVRKPKIILSGTSIRQVVRGHFHRGFEEHGEHLGPGLSAAIASFCLDSETADGEISKDLLVVARIVYRDLADKLITQTEKATWLDEKTPVVSFDFSDTRNLIVAVAKSDEFLAFRDGRSGYAEDIDKLFPVPIRTDAAKAIVELVDTGYGIVGSFMFRLIGSPTFEISEDSRPIQPDDPKKSRT